MNEKMFEAWQQSLVETVPNAWARAAILIVAAVVIAKLVEWVFAGWFKRWAAKTETDLDDQFFTIARRPAFFTVLALGLWLATRELGPSDVHLGVVEHVLLSIGIVVWTVFLFQFLRLALRILSAVEERFQLIQTRTIPLFENVGRVVLLGASIYALFLTWGIDVTAWLASAGIIGIAVGFAAKDSLANLFGGVFILADAPYQLGDYIVLDSGERGAVTNVGLRSTRLLTRDDVEITIPNAVIANAKITNQSGGPGEAFRVRVKVGAAYGSDIDQVREALMDVAANEPLVADEPAHRVRFRGFGDSSLDFELLCWVDKPVLRGRALDALNTAVYKRFLADGIEIPFPQRDVWVRQVATPASAPDE